MIPQPPRRPGLRLLLVSFSVLFLELALIRWLPTQVRVLAYFPNLVLIAAFLGLGVGSLRAGRGSLRWLWPAALLALVASAAAGSRVAFTQESVSEHLWLLYYDLGDAPPIVEGVRLPIVAAFVLTMLVFMAPGQAIGEWLQVFRSRSSALRGYAWDLGGSLLGVVGFALASVLSTRPIVWFAVGVGVGALVLAPRGRARWPYVIALGLVLAVILGGRRAHFYSPYYAIDVYESREILGGSALLTNGSLHQYALPMRRDDPGVVRGDFVEAYHRPYGLLGRPPRRALVLGAGTGNDVSVLLAEGAEHVDAVEIDPVILALGRSLHPDRPYDSPRVTAHVTDGRAFLADGDERYDLIVFGTLDSMTRVSALSNVRLDNFVYTRESIGAARRRLTPDGGMMLFFMVGERYIEEHLFAAITAAFGRPPLVVRETTGLFNRVFLAGPAFDRLRGDVPPPAAVAEALAQVEVPTDDWPFLYLADRAVSPFYLSLLAIFAVLGAAAVALASPELRRSVARRRGIDVEMMLFGLAFLLLETHFVTGMNLAWGATWITSAVVFGAILLTILLATLWIDRRGMPWWMAAGGLVVTMVAAYLVPTHRLVHEGLGPRLALSVLYVGAPIFFAACCFALRFASRREPQLALGWNLVGAVGGGLLEFSSMAFGIRALVLIALAAYLGAFVIRERERAAAPSESVASPEAPG